MSEESEEAMMKYFEENAARNRAHLDWMRQNDTNAKAVMESRYQSLCLFRCRFCDNGFHCSLDTISHEVNCSKRVSASPHESKDNDNNNSKGGSTTQICV